LPEAIREGTAKAWKALNNPRTGTMLNVFDALTETVARETVFDGIGTDKIIAHIKKAVHETHEQLPRLKQAGVVDAGALGMYIFFEGFFYMLASRSDACRSITETFRNRLHISPSFQEHPESGYCVDFVLEAPHHSSDELKIMTSSQKEVVIIPQGNLYKVHLHTKSKEDIFSHITKLGKVLNWEDDNLADQIQRFKNTRTATLHIMTDAAGSLTIQDAKTYGFTLLNSYLTVGGKCLPETHFQPEELYRAMIKGIPVSTSQASVHERHQCYESALERFERILYLCVGSVFTGNFETAIRWKKEHDKENRFLVLDTGAASGRLGTIVLATVRYLAKTNDMEKTVDFAKKSIALCEEYIFLEQLQFLAAGGRLSKTGAFFGDKLKIKPVISPLPDGAKKIGIARNREDQVKMALARMEASLQKESEALIMLEYSNNKQWLEGTFQKMITERYPHSEIILRPLSLTAGAHMGPGTWAVAFLAREKSEIVGSSS
jgi:DegV family protein with EDD domain